MYDYGYVFNKIDGDCVAWFEALEDAELYAKLKNRRLGYELFEAESTNLTLEKLRAIELGDVEPTLELLSEGRYPLKNPRYHS